VTWRCPRSVPSSRSPSHSVAGPFFAGNRYGVGWEAVRKAWIAAFEAPGDRSVQRSHLLLDHLVRASKSARGFPRGLELSTRILPYGPSFRRTLERALARRPDIVLLLDDTHLEEIRIERVALNRRPSDGALAAPTPLLPGAPAAYFTPLPLEAARRSSDRKSVV